MKVIIIGGGIIGVSIAYHLAEAGVEEITLVEKEKMLGLGATQYCSGGIRSQFTTPINVLFSKYALPDIYALADIVDLKKYGYLILDMAADSLPRVKMQRDLGVPVEYLMAKEVESRFSYINVEGVKSASYYGEDGITDPAALLDYWFAKAKAKGVRFIFGTEVKVIIGQKMAVEGVRTDKGDFQADKVILAAGVQSKELGATIGLNIPIVKCRKYVFVVDGLPFVHPLVMEIPTGWYIKKEGDNSLIGMSGKNEAHDFEKKEESLQETFEATVRRIPASENFKLKKTLTAMSDETPDKHAIIDDKAMKGLIIATGFSGHGFMHSPGVGKVVAALVKGEKPAIDVSPLALNRSLLKEPLAI